MPASPSGSTLADGPWVEFTLLASPRDVELVADALREVSGTAVSIEPALRRSEREDHIVEETEEAATLRTCVPAALVGLARERLERRLAALPLAAQPLAIAERTLAVDDWSERWKQFWGIERAGECIVVRPSWEPYAAREGEIVIALDPGQAFGTGQHASTRLALAALERELRPGARVLDLGYGSGILAIAAARLGASEAQGLDLDPSTLPVARENVRRNAVEGHVRLAVGTLDGGDANHVEAIASVAGGFDLVVANISSEVIVSLAPRIAGALRDGGTFIGSGFIVSTASEVRETLSACGLDVTRLDAEEVPAEDTWRCVTAIKRAQLPPRDTA